eukprot:Gb_36279 [translate_table: standard]
MDTTFLRFNFRNGTLQPCDGPPPPCLCGQHYAETTQMHIQYITLSFRRCASQTIFLIYVPRLLVVQSKRLIVNLCIVKSLYLPNSFSVLKMPGLALGDVVPNVEADSTHGRINLHDYIGDGWAIIFSHPADFTPACTTELGSIAKYIDEFEKRGVKLLALSCDDVACHKSWLQDIEAFTPGCNVNYPILADPNREIMLQLNMLDPDEKDANGKPLASRALHIIGPDKRLKLSFLYPGTTGRNFDEVLRVLDSLQLAAKHKIATPANWKQGERVVISPSVSNEDAKEMFPQGYETVKLPSGKDYLRLTQV